MTAPVFYYEDDLLLVTVGYYFLPFNESPFPLADSMFGVLGKALDPIVVPG